MQKMYSGIPFSPMTTLINNIGAADTVIEVYDISVFPIAPNYATIGTDENAETILYNAIAGNALSGCIRGIEGMARTWNSDTPVSRNFTNADYETIAANIKTSVQQGVGNANKIQFDDGETFQDKYDSGELTGPQGKQGETGRTPERGVDYFTESDIAEIVTTVIETLPTNTSLFKRMEGA